MHPSVLLRALLVLAPNALLADSVLVYLVAMMMEMVVEMTTFVGIPMSTPLNVHRHHVPLEPVLNVLLVRVVSPFRLAATTLIRTVVPLL